MSRPRMFPVIGLVLVAVAIPASSVAGAADSRTVTLKNIAFASKNLSITRGTKVRFAFRDDGTTHNVTSKGSKHFKTISDRETGTLSRTFPSAGTYRYECTLHPGMTGRIVVR